MKIAVNATLDARGLNCPLPILRTKKELAKLSAGEILEIHASDPGSVKDMTSFCEQTGHELLESASLKDEFVFMVKKNA